MKITKAVLTESDQTNQLPINYPELGYNIGNASIRIYVNGLSKAICTLLSCFIKIYSFLETVWLTKHLLGTKPYEEKRSF